MGEDWNPRHTLVSSGVPTLCLPPYGYMSECVYRVHNRYLGSTGSRDLNRTWVTLNVGISCTLMTRPPCLNMLRCFLYDMTITFIRRGPMGGP